MEYIYAAMLIHKAGKTIDEATLKKVLEAAGVAIDDARIKATVAALQGVNIDEAIEKAAVAAFGRYFGPCSGRCCTCCGRRTRS